MNHYVIRNTASGLTLGVYPGESERDALKSLMADSGNEEAAPAAELKAIKLSFLVYSDKGKWAGTLADVCAWHAEKRGGHAYIYADIAHPSLPEEVAQVDISAVPFADVSAAVDDVLRLINERVAWR